MKIEFAPFAPPRSGAVIVGAWEDRVLTAAARRLDEETGGAVSRAIAAAPRFHGKKNELLPLIGPPKLPLSRIVVAGLGKPEAVDARLLQDLGGNLVAHLNGAGETEAMFVIDSGDGAPGTPGVKPGEAAAQLAFGAALRAYRFDKYRTTEKPDKKPSLAAITVTTEAPDAAREAHRALAAAAEAIAFTRDLVSEPANTLYPETLAERAASLREFGVSVEILEETSRRDLGRGALRGVARGGARPPRLVVMELCGGPADAAPIAFVGKGVTFDTGGISIKPAA